MEAVEATIQHENTDTFISGIGQLERVPLREVWRHEAYDFTTWLEDSIEVLNDVIENEIVSVNREQAVGPFSVDLLGEDESGNYVVIENQLERSDHDHLGKLLTYATAYEAKTAVWIVSDPRPEHISVISWLNETTPTDFYLFKVEAVRIDESRPAPLLTKIVGPSLEGRQVGSKKHELDDSQRLRTEFWTQHLDRARQQTTLHSEASPGYRPYISTSAGVPGISIGYGIRQHNAVIDLYIDRKDAETGESMFDQLVAHREMIEQKFGDALDWDRMDGRRACRIRKTIATGGYLDRDRWDETQDAMIDAMIRFEQALRPYIDNLKV